jgi:hypothetical protein
MSNCIFLKTKRRIGGSGLRHDDTEHACSGDQKLRLRGGESSTGQCSLVVDVDLLKFYQKLI